MLAGPAQRSHGFSAGIMGVKLLGWLGLPFVDLLRFVGLFFFFFWGGDCSIV